MDYQKITEVPTATALTGNESIYIRQGDTFRRVSIADFLAALGIQDGDDGISPAVTVATITGGHRLTITDAGGPKSFDVMDGAAGQPGAKGDKGDKGDPGSAAIGLGVCASAADAATKVVSVHTADFAANRSGILTVAFSVGANIADEPSLSINNKLYAIIDCRDGQSARRPPWLGRPTRTCWIRIYPWLS